MGDFDLNRSRWYSTMKMGLACDAAKQAAATITERTNILYCFDYDAVIGAELAQAETALSEALLAVKLARSAYEKTTAKPRRRGQPMKIRLLPVAAE